MSSILNNTSQLINLKNRLGLNIAQRSSVSVYMTERQVKRQLEELLCTRMIDKMERCCTIDKILEKCDTIEKLKAIQLMFQELTAEKLFETIAKGIRFFMNEIKRFITDESELETEY